jgi:hypothetical protein
MGECDGRAEFDECKTSCFVLAGAFRDQFVTTLVEML